MPTPVHFCTTVRDRRQALERLLHCIAGFSDLRDFQLIVVDQGSSDDVPAVLGASVVPVQYVRVESPWFNRSRGLNLAVKHAAPDPQDILYFTDVDMYMSADYLERLRTIVQQGVCWFPICYSLHKDRPRIVNRDSRNAASGANGWWRTEGKGMCGFTAADFEKLGGWDETIGQSYGKEDGDLARRAQKAGLQVVRQNTVGLFHCWHPRQRDSYQKPR